MSGCTGADRILHKDVESVVEHFTTNVLSKYPLYSGKYTLTGSYIASPKDDYGDIDLVVLFEDVRDKKWLKKNFAKYLEEHYDKHTIQPFTSEKHKGKRTYNAGELVTIKYPQVIYNGLVIQIKDEKPQSVQIDCIIATSEEELEFKRNFLNLPAEVQGLYIGIIKVALLETTTNIVGYTWGLGETEIEREYNISQRGLQMRKVLLDKETLKQSKVVMKSGFTCDWKEVEKIINQVNPSITGNTFEGIVDIIKENFTDRSKRRIKGLFSSMVSIKSGEVGTEKGTRKQYCLDYVRENL